MCRLRPSHGRPFHSKSQGRGQWSVIERFNVNYQLSAHKSRDELRRWRRTGGAVHRRIGEREPVVKISKTSIAIAGSPSHKHHALMGCFGERRRLNELHAQSLYPDKKFALSTWDRECSRRLRQGDSEASNSLALGRAVSPVPYHSQIRHVFHNRIKLAQSAPREWPRRRSFSRRFLGLQHRSSSLGESRHRKGVSRVRVQLRHGFLGYTSPATAPTMGH